MAFWSLMDSGSSINGVDIPKVLPGATIGPSKAQNRGDSYACADGGTLKNEGQTTTDTRSAEGHAREITWQNVKVEFPILSTAGYTCDDYDVL